MATYAAKASDGTGLPTTDQYGVYTAARNNRGTIKANGTSASSLVNNVSTRAPAVSTFASTPIDNSVTVKDYAAKAVSGGTFAHNHTKPISSLITTELAGLTNNSILSPGNDGDVIRSINKLETLRSRRFTTAIRSNKYNRVTNTFDNGFPVVDTDTLLTDNAATPTRSSPGQLIYRTGGPKPKLDDYKSKTN